jgi:hypothetical protein
LGVTPDISNDALKTHYRRLVVETHPDKMVARGVPSECVSMATKKNRCYQCRLRGRRQRATHLIGMDSSAHRMDRATACVGRGRRQTLVLSLVNARGAMRMIICRLS